MKICPTCGEVYPLADEHCRVHGVELQDWSEATQVVVMPKSEEHTHLDPVPGTIVSSSESVAHALRSRPATRVHMNSTGGRRQTGHALAPRGGRLLADRYRLSRQLGIGGYGAVFDAFDERLEKRVAVKVLSPALAQRPDVLERFRREAIAASQVRHSGIVDISDFAADGDGSFFIAMELLDGIDLADLIAERGTIAPERCLEIVRQCAEALTAAHAAGILHRDLKPANIFLTGQTERSRCVKIIDFGICKLRDQARRGGGPDQRLQGGWYTSVYVARTGDGAQARRPRRRLLTWRDPLRDARGGAAIFGTVSTGNIDRTHRGATRSAVERQSLPSRSG